MVPWERVFLCGDVARCNALFEETGAGVHMIHHTVVKTVAKAEFMLGIAAMIAEVTERRMHQVERYSRDERHGRDLACVLKHTSESDATADNNGAS